MPHTAGARYEPQASYFGGIAAKIRHRMACGTPTKVLSPYSMRPLNKANTMLPNRSETPACSRHRSESVFLTPTLNRAPYPVQACKEKWDNALNPLLRRCAFTPAEDQLLIEAHVEEGAGSWKAMKETKLPFRAANNIKNHWCVWGRVGG